MPEEFGRYELHELLGRGGMGEVYRALDTVRERTVALKLLSKYLAEDESFKSRFRRESRMVARLNEPHIIPIHDFGEIDNQLFIDMRLVEGADLGTVLDRGGALDAEVAISVISQVASALDAAHRSGLVHRDVKPSNILLTGLGPERGGDPFAYLVDFGIAHSATQEGTVLTATTGTVGTVAYMSPERIGGDSGDHTTDVYALACVLHETLSGHKPFDGELFAMMYAHMHTPPPKVTARAPDLPAGLDEVICKGMSKNATERYPTAGEFARAARAALRADTPALTRSTSPQTVELPPPRVTPPRRPATPPPQPQPATRPPPPRVAEHLPPPVGEPRRDIPPPSEPVSWQPPPTGGGEWSPPQYPSGPTGAYLPAPPYRPAPPKRTGRRRAVIAGVTAALLIAVVAVILTVRRGGSPAADKSALPAAAADSIAAVDLGSTTVPAAPKGAVLGSWSGGITLTRLGPITGYGTGSDARSAPPGQKLIAFATAAWRGNDFTTSDLTSSATVSVDGGAGRAVPKASSGQYVVVAVPSNARTVDLVLSDRGLEQSISLLTGEPGPGNVVVLARAHRESAGTKTAKVVFTYSVPLAFTDGKTGTTDSATVTIDPTVVNYRTSPDDGAKTVTASSPRKAILHIGLSYVSAHQGGPFEIPAGLITFTPTGGAPIHARDIALKAGTLYNIFDVAGDVTTGTLTIAGSIKETSTVSYKRGIQTPVRIQINIPPG